MSLVRPDTKLPNGKPCLASNWRWRGWSDVQKVCQRMSRMTHEKCEGWWGDGVVPGKLGLSWPLAAAAAAWTLVLVLPTEARPNLPTSFPRQTTPDQCFSFKAWIFCVKCDKGRQVLLWFLSWLRAWLNDQEGRTGDSWGIWNLQVKLILIVCEEFDWKWTRPPMKESWRWLWYEHPYH